MYFLTSFCLAVLLTFTSGSPLGSRSLNVNLISCPKDSVILDQFLESSPCSVYCLTDGDCSASGLVCCSTGCGTRCVAEAILETSDSNDQRSLDKESMIDKQLAVLKEKLDEKRKEQESHPFTIYDEDDGEEYVVANETVADEEEEMNDDDSVEEYESSDEGDEQPEDEVEDDEDEEEEAEQEEEVSPTPSPSFQQSSTSTVDMDDSSEDDGDAEDGGGDDEDGDDDDDDSDDDDDGLAGEGDDDVDDDDDETEFDDYSYFEEVTEEDLEFLLMKLLLALKNKQKSTHSPWSDVVHNSRSLLEESKDDPFKNDFFINALPPADALKSHEAEEGKRELEGSMQGFFQDEPFKREDISHQGATGRRSSMERREKLAREVDQEDSPNLTKELINASNMMR